MRRQCRKAMIHATAVFTILLLVARIGQSGTLSTWNGSNGNWNVATNWSTNPFFPNNGNGEPTYDAVIGSGAANLNTDVTLSSLTLNGGTLNGSGNIATTNLTVNGGTLSTAGNISASKVDLTTGTVNRDLTLPTTTTNTIQNVAIGSGFTLTVPVGSTLTGTTGPGDREGLGPGLLENQGTFIVTGGGRYYASMPLNNDGDVKVQQGNLRLNSTGTHTGTFEVSSATQLELSGTQTFQPSATVSGGLGGLVIISGTATLNNDVSTGYIRLINGTLTGSGNLHPSQFSLDGGTIGRDLTLPTTATNTIQNVAIGSGFTLTVPVGSTLTGTTGPGDREGLGPGMLENKGTFIVTGGGRYYASMPMNNDGDVQVQQGNLRLNSTGTHTGTFEVSSGAQLELSGTQTFQPSATVSGSLGGLVINSGTATLNSDVSTGYIWLINGTLSGTGNLHPGQFTLDGGTIGRNLTLPTTTTNSISNVSIGSGFTLTVPVGSTLTATTSPGDKEGLGPGLLENQGTFVKTGGSRYYASMPMNNDGDVQVQQGNLRLNSTGTHTGTFEVSNNAQLELSGTQMFQPGAMVSGLGGLVINSGTATLNNTVSAGYLWQIGGTLAGNGNLSPGHFTFTGGTLARDLTLNASTSNSITTLGIADGFTLTNPSVGQLGTSSGTVTGPGSFVNQGTINKTGAGTETFATFANSASGAVNVQAGTLALSGIGTQQGTFTVSNNATLTFGGQSTSNTTLTTGTLITGAGKVNVAQGVLNLSGGTSNDYTGGTTIGSGGRVNITGTGTGLSPAAATIQSGGVVSIGDASNLLSAQALVQTGGTLAVRNDFIPQAQIAATSSGTFGIDLLGFATTVDLSSLGNSSMSMGSSQTGSYVASTLGVGAGNTYRLGGGGGTITLTQANVLTGGNALAIVGPGTVVLPQPQNFTQGTTVQNGTVAVGSTGSLGAGPITFQGGGLQASGGPITINNDVTMAGNFTLGGSSDLTLAGTEKLTGNRTVTVSNTGLTTISGNITQDIAGRGLTKAGTGSLVLSGNNSFTGGLNILGGTVTLASQQTYGGTTTVDLGSTLVLNADLLGGGNVTVRGGGTLMGEGIVAGTTTIANSSFVSPGHSPGILNFSNGLALQNGSHYSWELGALSTANPGSDWDQLGVTGGQLSILAGALLDLKFIGSALSPSTGASFWHSSHRWDNIVNLTSPATNPTGFVNFTIDNTLWSQFGFFATASAESGLGVDLVWNPVPEPSTWALLAIGAVALLAFRSKGKAPRPNPVIAKVL